MKDKELIKDVGEEIISALKELDQQIDKLKRDLRNGGKELTDTSDS